MVEGFSTPGRTCLGQEAERGRGKLTGWLSRGRVAMKNVGVIAILAGIVVIILALVGVVGQGGGGRTVMVGAVILIVVGYLLYKRGQRPA
jgi:hypothetical protein